MTSSKSLFLTWKFHRVAKERAKIETSDMNIKDGFISQLPASRINLKMDGAFKGTTQFRNTASADETTRSRRPLPVIPVAPVSSQRILGLQTSRTRKVSLPDIQELPSDPGSVSTLHHAQHWVPSTQRTHQSRSSATSQKVHSHTRQPSRHHVQTLPRLMFVANTYLPKLDDELRVSVGETVRMTKEFDDGWCYAEHIGRADLAPRGVVPRACLVEKQRPVEAMSQFHARLPSK